MCFAGKRRRSTSAESDCPLRGAAVLSPTVGRLVVSCAGFLSISVNRSRNRADGKFIPATLAFLYLTNRLVRQTIAAWLTMFFDVAFDLARSTAETGPSRSFGHRPLIVVLRRHFRSLLGSRDFGRRRRPVERVEKDDDLSRICRTNQVVSSKTLIDESASNNNGPVTQPLTPPALFSTPRKSGPRSEQEPLNRVNLETTWPVHCPVTLPRKESWWFCAGGIGGISIGKLTSAGLDCRTF